MAGCRVEANAVSLYLLKMVWVLKSDKNDLVRPPFQKVGSRSIRIFFVILSYISRRGFDEVVKTPSVFPIFP